jgi:hypothetical protein
MRGCMILLLVGCGTSAEPSASPEAPPVATKSAAAARWLECTEASRAPMEAVLLARHHLEKVDDRVDGLRCVTMQLAEHPAFFVELVASEHDQRRRLHGVVALDGTTELVALRDANLGWAQQRGGKVTFETVDLDGDARDEVLVHYDDRRQLAEWVDVIAIRDRALVERKGPRVSYDDPDVEETCRGVLATERVGAATHLVVTTTGSTGKSEHCLDNGRHVFALESDLLVELAAR